MVKIAPSILAADQENLESEVKKIDEMGYEYVHIDVMDGLFVTNKTKGLEMLMRAKSVSSRIMDVHFMVENPEEYMIPYIKYADILTFHVEAVDEDTANRIICYLHDMGKKVGMSIKPATSIEKIIPYLEKIDVVLIMTVEPGYGGQKLIPETIEKIKELRKINANIDIEVDGGINSETEELVIKAGANILVEGTAIFKK